MKLESYQRPRPTINLTALIDVLFILVVFVMLAASFDDVGVLEVNLPGADSDRKAQPDAVILVVPASGPARIEGQAVADADLEERLRGLRQARGERALIMAADRTISLDRATTILSAATRAGFEAVSLATQDPIEAGTGAGTRTRNRDERP
jgi:biopolymer transport protein ExbD